jgi:hypothetical protein
MQLNSGDAERVYFYWHGSKMNKPPNNWWLIIGMLSCNRRKLIYQEIKLLENTFLTIYSQNKGLFKNVVLT